MGIKGKNFQKVSPPQNTDHEKMEGSAPPTMIRTFLSQYNHTKYFKYESDYMTLIMGMYGTITTDIHLYGCPVSEMAYVLNSNSYKYPMLAVSQNGWRGMMAEGMDRMAPMGLHDIMVRNMDEKDWDFELDFRTQGGKALLVKVSFHVMEDIENTGTSKDKVDLIGAIMAMGMPMKKGEKMALLQVGIEARLG